jgi:hypothetical protein
VKIPWLSRNFRLLAVIVPTAVILQPVKGVSDHGLDLVLVIVALASLRLAVPAAVAWGLASGLLVDLCSVSWVGPHLIGNAAVAVFASLLRYRIYRERVPLGRHRSAGRGCVDPRVAHPPGYHGGGFRRIGCPGAPRPAVPGPRHGVTGRG